jgi:hypothetical protein
MKITYKQLTAQIDAPEARFCTVTGMPANAETAMVLLRQYQAIIGQNNDEWCSADVFCGYTLGVDIWFIHPRSCPAKLSQIARRHLSAVLRKLAPNDSFRAAIYDGMGFSRASYSPQPNLTVIERAREIDLVPTKKGFYGYARALGIEIEGTSPHEHESLAGYLPYYTRVVSDSSIKTIISGHTAAEVKILLDRATFDQRLTRVCKTLNELGFATNRSCGLHVHLDARHLDMSTRQKMQRNMTKWLSLLIELVPLSRRDNSYCKLDLRSGRYCAVSVQTGGKNTIEIRLHSATVDQTKITMWLRLLELLAVLPPPAPKLTTTLLGVESLPLCEWDKNYWRARHRQLNPGSYPDSTASTNENE